VTERVKKSVVKWLRLVGGGLGLQPLVPTLPFSARAAASFGSSSTSSSGMSFV
jgi:hypothetical protein